MRPNIAKVIGARTGFIIIACTLLVAVSFLVSTKNTSCMPKVITVCVKEPEVSQTSAIDSVTSLVPKMDKAYLNNHRKLTCPERISPVKTANVYLSKQEHLRFQKCVSYSLSDAATGHDDFWSGDTQYIRHTHHQYLGEESVVLDVGGNVGEDAAAMIHAYDPAHYVILEPMTLLFRTLKEKFKNKTNVHLYNFGVGSRNEKFFVNIMGNSGDATSVFTDSGIQGTCPLHVVNTTEFLLRLGVGCVEIDLVTINCEGCEYDFLEMLLSTNMVNYFRNIQFATHTKLPRLKRPYERYCEIQEKLARTHVLTYQFKFQWESWKRKDIF